MDQNLRHATEKLLKLHEGFRRYVYKDTVGILTVGYGRNLVEKGISEYEAEFMLGQDIDEAYVQCVTTIPFFRALDVVRQTVLMDMCHNLGIRGLLKFKNTLRLIGEKRYEDAAGEMLKSLWAEQVMTRAVRLSLMMKSGEVPGSV